MMRLEADGLVVVRGESVVLDGVGFALTDGGMLVLRGPNGSGKSSLLRVLAGLIRPAAGRLLWDGREALEDLPAHARRVALLGHADAVKPGLDCVENLRFASRVSGRDGRAIEEALEAVGLAALGRMPARLLSSGQRRRLAIARLALSRAALWLMDEPTTGLDAASVGVLGGLIEAHRVAGGAVVASTHLDLPAPGADVLALG